MVSIRYLHKKIAAKMFSLRGGKPWTWGYQEYKEEMLGSVLANRAFSTYSLPAGYGLRLDERIVEYPWFFSRLPSGPGKLLDAGSVLNYEWIVSHPSIAEKKLFISTLAPEPIAFWERGINYVYEDLRESCYRDAYFDWIVSLSTIEHIGLDNTVYYTKESSMKENKPASYLDAIREFRRILKPGGVLYVSVPFGKHRNSGWFQVFDSEMIDQLVRTFSPGSSTEYHFKYEPEGWRVSTREESKDATCFDIREKKGYDPDLAAFSRAVVCLELIR